MNWKTHVLVVANVTAFSDELQSALETRAARERVKFTLIVPATAFAGGRAAARERLNTALARLRRKGLDVDGYVAASDPLVAVSEAWDPGRFDEIVLSTLPMRVSKWLRAGLPERIAQLTGAPVTHVIVRPPGPPIELTPARPRRRSPIGPLSVLGWGGHPDARARVPGRGER